MKELDRLLDQYVGRFGIVPGLEEDAVTQDVQRFLSMPTSLLSKMTWQECAEGCLVLRQLAFRLQKDGNREQARANWAVESADKMIAKVVDTYPGYTRHDRRLVAVNDNDATIKLEEIRVMAQLRVDRIANLAKLVTDMAHTLAMLAAGKRGNREQY